MAIEAEHYIDGKRIYPVNGDDIGFVMNFTGKEGLTQNEVNVDNVILATEAKKIVNNQINNGYGLFQGIPYQIKIENVILDYFIDLVDSPKISGDGDSSIEVSIKKRQSFELFKKNADVLSFEAINKTHPINTFNVPYLIIRDNQGELIIMLGLAIYTLTKALIEAIKDLVTSITDGIKATTPNVGIPPSFDTGDIISFILLTAARIIYTASMLAALINLVKQIMDIIFPPLHYLKGSTFLELINKGCDKLGYSFNSSILNEYSALSVLPVPLVPNSSIFERYFFSAWTDSYNKGYPTARDTTPTLGSLIDAILDMFNAQIKVEGNTVRLERRDYWNNTSSRRVQNTLNLQGKRENQWTYNTGEMWKRYYLHYQVDPSDIHSLDNIEGTDCEYSTEPINVGYSDLINIKGLVDITIPFALGARKDSLNFVENYVLVFAQLADSITGIFGGGTNFVSSITGRVGVVKISQQYFTVTKMLYLSNGKQPSNYLSKINANNIYSNYHFINEVDKNLKRIYEEEIKFSSKDFEALQDNNYVYNLDGELLEVLDFEWINKGKKAKLRYAVKALENTNTKTILING